MSPPKQTFLPPPMVLAGVFKLLLIQTAALERTPGDGAEYSRTCHHNRSLPLVKGLSKCECAQYSTLDQNKVPLHACSTVDCTALMQPKCKQFVF